MDIARPPADSLLDERAAVLRGLLWVIWRARGTVLSCVLLATAVGLAAAFLPDRVYKATVILAPAQHEEGAGGLSSLLGQLDGMASLLSLGGLGGNDQTSLAILHSRAFAESFIRDNSLLPTMFSRKWDSEHQRWKTDRPPTMDDAWALFDKKVRMLTQDQKTGIVSLSIRWRDRQLAAKWANELADRINVEMRRRVTTEADASLAILQGELPKVTEVELRQAIFKLSEAQLRRKILANSRPDFAFTIIDRATVPDVERFDSPKRGLIIAFAVFAGLLIGLIWSTTRAALSAKE